MIYPFTRIVVYGSIWYQGEANAGNPTYACKFAKMIESWRQTWNERTNGITDIQFPFGFVQVSFIQNNILKSIDTLVAINTVQRYENCVRFSNASMATNIQRWLCSQ